MEIYEVLKYFDNVKGENGNYMGKCPCHDDNVASLSITAKDGITLIHCFAGCRAKDIVEKVGLTFDDLRDKRSISWKTQCREYN